MKFENLEKLFQNYVKGLVKKNPDKYSDPSALEDDLGKMNEEFENTVFWELDGNTPADYVRQLCDEKELFNYVDYCLENNIEVPDIVCDAVVRVENAVEYLNGLIYEKNPDANRLAAILMSTIGTPVVEDLFIKMLMNAETPDDVITVIYEFLSEGKPRVADKILEVINETPAPQQGVMVEILSNFKGRKDIFYWLITMLQRAEDVPLYAGLLGSYGDVAAIDILKSFAAENDINYMEYVEIRNAVEELGGDMDVEKDFADDPYYKYMMGIDADNGEN